MDSVAARLAYLQVRMPATFAANTHVLRRIPQELEIRTVLDVGSGPGTSMWAAAETFTSVEKFTLVERDTELIEIGRRLASVSSRDAVRSARWEHGDTAATEGFEAHDLVMMSFVLGELAPGVAERVVRSVWAKTRKALVIIEPGTPRNFAGLVSARALLIEAGAYAVAPCPHINQCPLAAIGDWCHFAERLQRSSEHRRIKGGTLGYEDEKFSYFVASKAPVDLPEARIVRHPLKHKGHVQMTLCTSAGLKRQTVAKSQKLAYKAARDARWGDEWNQTP